MPVTVAHSRLKEMYAVLSPSAASHHEDTRVAFVQPLSKLNAPAPKAITYRNPPAMTMFLLKWIISLYAAIGSAELLAATK
jgi:hypothetical protein